MTRPSTTIAQVSYRNPHASELLILPVEVACNTSDEDLQRNIAINAARDLPWAQWAQPHDGIAIMCGGGPSIADHIDEIRDWQVRGATVFAMNGAARYLHERGVTVDYQVIADAKPETAVLVYPHVTQYLIASQVHPETLKGALDWDGPVTLWHLAISEDMDRLFPEERRKRGGYVLVGGGAAVGNSALALAYTRGFRRFECYGYDSSNRGESTHAYEQPMNQFIPVADVPWAGKVYTTSVAMKAQAEKFQITAQALKSEGCTVNVHGDGLLPAMWNTQARDLTEHDKYRLLWCTETYRAVSPGEGCVPLIMEHLKPDGLTIDFGCGTGRASLELLKRGVPVLLIDFADNCRDEEAIGLPFLEWDLTRPLPPSAKYGICTDVMEHLPTADVRTAVKNIMDATENVFFQISTTEDHCGALIGHHLHLTVQRYEWWYTLFMDMGYDIAWSQEGPGTVCFVIRRDTARSE